MSDDDEVLAALKAFRLAANRAATSLIAGRINVDGAVEQFVEEAEPHLVSALGLRPANECQYQD